MEIDEMNKCLATEILRLHEKKTDKILRLREKNWRQLFQENKLAIDPPSTGT